MDVSTNVRFRIRTDGLKELIDAKGAVVGFIDAAGKAREVSGRFAAIGSTLHEAANGGRAATESVIKLSGALISAHTVIGLVRQGFEAVKAVTIDAVMTGVMFNAQMETSRLSIAALVGAFGDVRDANGRLLSTAEAFNGQLVIAERLQQRLKVAALQTSAEYSDMLEALQIGIGPALKAGFSEDQIVKFTQRMTQVAGAIGLPFNQLSQEIRAMFEGDTSRQSRIPRLLFGDMKNVKAEIDKLSKEGGDALYDFFDKKMKPFAEAGDKASKTFAGALSNLKDAITQALGAATQGEFSKITQMLLDLTAKIVTFDEAGNATFNEDFVNGVKAVSEAFAGLAGKLVSIITSLDDLTIKWKALKQLADENTPDLPKGVSWMGVGRDLLASVTHGGSEAGIAAYKAATDAVNRRADALRAVEALEQGLQRKSVRDLGSHYMTGGISGLYSDDPSNRDAKKVAFDAANLSGLTLQTVQKKVGELADAGEYAKIIKLFKETNKAAADGTLTVAEYEKALRSTELTLTGKKGGTPEVDEKHAKALAALKEQLAVMAAQADMVELQGKLVGEVDVFRKAHLDAEIKILAVNQEQAALVRAMAADKILSQKEKDTKIDAGAENAALKTLNIRADEERVVARLAVEEGKRLDALKQGAAQAETSIAISKRSLEIKQLELRGILTAADVEKRTSLEKANALDEYKQKLDAIDAKLKQDRQAVIAVTNMGDLPSLARGLKQVQAMEAKANADRLQAQVDLDGKIADVHARSVDGMLAVEAAKMQGARMVELQQAAAFWRAAAEMGVVGAFEMYRGVLRDIDKLTAEQQRKLEAMRAFQDSLRSSMVGLVEGITSGSLKNALLSVADSFRDAMLATVDEFVRKWIEANTYEMGPDGKPRVDERGNPILSTKGKVLGGAQLVIGAGMGGYEAGYSGTPGARTGSVIGGAIGGAAWGATSLSALGPYGAAVGLIIGAIAGAIGGAVGAAQRQSEYKYLSPSIVNGTAILSGNRNVNNAQRMELQTQMQDVFNDSWNAFTKVMLRLPGGVVPGPANIDIPIQPEASAHMLEHFQQYLKETLPKAIAELFREGMETSFVRAGMTKAAFQKFWNEADSLDASSRGQFWQDLANGVADFAEAKKRMADVNKTINYMSDMTPDFFGGYKGYEDINFTAGGTSVQRLNQHGQRDESDFVSNVREGAKGMFDMARQMIAMTGPERVAAFRALGQSVNEMTKALTDYLTGIAEILAGLKEAFGDAQYQHDMGNAEREGDVNKQIELSWRRYEDIMAKLANPIGYGLTPEDIDRLTREAMGLIESTYRLNPTKEADAVWKTEMERLRLISEEALKAMGEHAKTAVEALIAQLDPFVDWFLGMPVDIDAALVRVVGSFDGFKIALDELIAKISATPAPGGGDDDDDDDGDGGDRGPRDPVLPPIIINMNGTSFGVDELVLNITNAVIAALREDPSRLDGQYLP